MYGSAFLILSVPTSLALGIFLGSIAAASSPTSRLYRLRRRLLCLGGKGEGTHMQRPNSSIFSRRNRIVVYFYWVLFTLSMYCFYRTMLKPISAILPHQSGSVRQWKKTAMDLRVHSFSATNPSVISLVHLLSVPFFNILSAVCFSVTCLRDPGVIVPKAETERSDDATTDTADGDSSCYNCLYPQRVCTTCHTRRPPRAHHCRVCDHCVMDFDHHCIWVNNCVGRYNLLWFNGFLFFTSVAILNSAFVNLVTIWAILTRPEFPFLKLVMSKQITVKFMSLWLSASLPIHSVSALMHGLVGIVLLPFSLMHIRNVFQNVRTSERIKRDTIIAQLYNQDFALLAEMPIDECHKLPPIFTRLQRDEIVAYTFHFVELIAATYGDNTTIEGISGRVLTIAESVHVIRLYNPFNKGRLANIREVVHNGMCTCPPAYL